MGCRFWILDWATAVGRTSNAVFRSGRPGKAPTARLLRGKKTTTRQNAKDGADSGRFCRNHGCHRWARMGGHPWQRRNPVVYIRDRSSLILHPSSFILTANWLRMHLRVLVIHERHGGRFPLQRLGQAEPLASPRVSSKKMHSNADMRTLLAPFRRPRPGTTSNQKTPDSGGVCKFAHTVRERGRLCRHCSSFRQAQE